jgi:hypothetical protein
MNITHFRRERLYKTFKEWEIPEDFADPNTKNHSELKNE